jgi:glycerate kinase
VPLADGGDGLLSAFGGELRQDEVTGPLGKPVLADWKLVPPGPSHDTLTAVIEMANASGLLVAGGEADNDPIEATTLGTGQLVSRAVAEGARRVIVGCGGSATTDGGLGALEAIGSREALQGVELVAACDVTTGFLDAARVFAPQKGANPDQVVALSARLEVLAKAYRDRFGIDVTTIPGAGAAGGLAGGLLALGAKIVSGFELVADFVSLDEHLARADLVMTGEGFLDRQSFSGKVVGGVIKHVAGRAPILCVAGNVAADLDPVGLEVVSLVERAGLERALADVLDLIEEVVAQRVSLRT